MLIMLAALLQQAPALDADTYRAAMTCRTAGSVEAVNARSLPMMAEVAYFTMIAARETNGPGSVMDRMDRINSDASPAAGVTPGNSAALMAACLRRFPLARRSTPAPLPAGAFERDVMCAGALSVMVGMAEGMRMHFNDSSDYDRLMPLMGPYTSRAEARMAERGVTDEATMRREVDDQLAATLDLGNLDAIVRACEAHYART